MAAARELRERQSGSVEDNLHVNDVGRDERILINAEREGSLNEVGKCIIMYVFIYVLYVFASALKSNAKQAY